MPARLVIVVAALAAVVALASSVRAHDRCQNGLADVFAAATGHGTPAARKAGLRAIRSSCRDASSLAAAAGVLHTQGRDGPAMVLASEATRRAPQDARGWAALAVAAQRRAPRTALDAAERFVRLSPLDGPPVPVAALRARIAAGRGGP